MLYGPESLVTIVELKILMASVEIDITTRSQTTPRTHRALWSNLRAHSGLKAIVSIFDQGMVSATNFLTGVMIGRGSPEDLGIYALIMAVLQIAIGIQSELVSTPYAVLSHRYRDQELKHYASHTLAFQFVFLILAGLITFGLLTYSLSSEALSRWQHVLLVLCWAGPMILLRDFLRHFSFARLELYHAFALDAFICAVQLAALGYLFVSGELTLIGTLVVISTAVLIAAIVWGWVHRDLFYVNDWAIPRFARENFSYSKWSLVTYMMGSTTPFLMPWVLVAYESERMIGIYSACSTLMGLSYMFVIGVANMLKAKAAYAFTHEGLAGLQKVLVMTLALYLTFLIPFCLMVTFLSDWLMLSVFGPEFTGYGMVSIVIACNVLVGSISIVIGNGLCAMRRPEANINADVGTLLITIITALVMIPQYGILGAAFASLAGTSIGVVLRFLSALKVFHQQQRLGVASEVTT